MSFKVVSEELTAHGSHLDGIVDRLKTALDAGKTASMSEDAYGLLCSFVPPIVNPMEEDGVKALEAAVEGVTKTADNVRSTAKQYAESDSDNEKEFKRLLDSPDAEKPVLNRTQAVSAAQPLQARLASEGADAEPLRARHASEGADAEPLRARHASEGMDAQRLEPWQFGELA